MRKGSFRFSFGKFKTLTPAQIVRKKGGRSYLNWIAAQRFSNLKPDQKSFLRRYLNIPDEPPEDNGVPFGV